MLLKLLKYDFRAMWKQFSLVWGAALVLALVNRFTNSSHFRLRYLDFEGRIAELSSMVFLAVFVAMFLLAIIFVIHRFSKGLLGGEGYLMHTLPVRPWQLVLSKLICGTVTWVISGVVAFVSPFLMMPDWSIFVDFRFWSDIFRGLFQHPDTLLLVTEFCAVVLSFILQSIAVIYLAISVGHLFSRHKRLVSVAAFIGLYILLVNVYNQVFSMDLVIVLTDVTTSNVHGSMLTAIATMLIPAAVFLAAVCWILEHKLNLE